jgi:hypothetical protein
MKPKIVAVSSHRYRATAAERRLHGGNTVTEFIVYREEDRHHPERWRTVRGYGPTPGERKTDAIRRSGFLEEAKPSQTSEQVMMVWPNARDRRREPRRRR